MIRPETAIHVDGKPATIATLRQLKQKMARYDRPRDYLAENYRFRLAVYREGGCLRF